MDTSSKISFDPFHWLARLISIVVHPLWWPTAGLYLLLLINPYLFGVSEPSARKVLILQVFILTFILPVFAIFLLKKLELIKAYTLDDRMDRTGPYLITMIFYIWLYINIRHDPEVPLVYNIFVFGALITLILIFISNLFVKVSAHTAVMGGLFAMIWLTFNVFSHEQLRLEVTGRQTMLSWRFVLIAGVVLAGLTGTCRLYLKAHRPKEVYLGYVLGFIAQLISFKILF